ncbi:MAG: DUF4189 domain-containing protein [Planctomycetes bacterium]|nr:DUF4189 domain-containing protein [Planctomycetota bacterium]MBL7039731.1 DUF4189 domain-containing protein [Pirellulaceae bacterium]
MATSRRVWTLLIVIAVLAANYLALLASPAWAERRGRRHRHAGGWDKGWHESGWYDPFWVRLRRAPKYWESQSQPATSSYSRERYAAIAYSPSTGKYGYSHGSSSRCSAERAALGHCPEKDVRILAWTRNAWCVLALGDSVGEYGWAWATDSQRAKSRAIEECRKRTTNCYIAVCVFSGN